MAKFIEFPIFTGVAGELRPWISWLEAFFVREKFTKLEKMNLAQSLLEGKAEAWFYRYQEILLFQSWKDLKESLLLKFGDFADSDRIRLIAEQDQFFKEIEDEAKIQRMETTSLNLQESISSIATIRETITVVEETSEIIAGNLDERASEKKLVSQYQVPVSSLEPSLSFSSEPLDVSASWPCAIVSTNPVHSQSGFESVKNLNNAHHVFDELSHRRHKCQQRKTLSLYPKSRMFKFKHRTLLSNWSQMDLHQVMDISQVNNLSPCFSANFGLVRKTRTFQCLRLKKQAHKSRVLYQLRMLHDPGGKKDEHFDDNFETETMQPEGWSEACDAAIDALEGPGTWIVTSLPANKISIGCQGVSTVKLNAAGSLERFTAKLVANLITQSGVGLANLIGEPIWRVHDDYSFVLYRTAYHEWHRWKHKTAYLQGLLEFVVFALVKLQDIDKEMDANLQMIAKVAAICNDASVEQSDQQLVSRGMPTEAALKVLVENMGFSKGLNKASSNGDALRCCRLWSELEQRIATLEFDRDRKSMGVMVDSSSGNKFLLVTGAVENVLDRSTRIQLLAGSVQALDQYSRDLILQRLHDMSMGALRCLRFQQNSSSIWHRWRRKPLFLLHFWKKNCWYQRWFLLSGLC